MEKNKFCECGKIVYAKNICVNCYQKKRNASLKNSIGNKFCECGKIVYAKNICVNCYQKKRNDSVKNSIGNKFCECGKIVYAKNICVNCYQKKRSISILIEKGTYVKKEDKYLIKQNKYNLLYQKVLEQVIKGMNISQSCDIVGINRKDLYNNITPIQKRELISYKALNRKY